MKKKLGKHLQPIDQQFSMDNYNYVTKDLENPQIETIYKTLGPFDYTLYQPDQEKEEVSMFGGPKKDKD